MTVCVNRGRILAASLLLMLSANASAAITASQAWIREVPPQSPVAAAFVVLTNTGKSADYIVAMSSPMAGRVEWHDMRHEHGHMEMTQRLRPELPAGVTTSLAPMASHLMLMELKQPLRVGMNVPLLLKLASGKTLRVSAEVRVSD